LALSVDGSLSNSYRFGKAETIEGSYFIVTCTSLCATRSSVRNSGSSLDIELANQTSGNASNSGTLDFDTLFIRDVKQISTTKLGGIILIQTMMIEEENF
jgi:hypothetical protein